MMSAVRPAETAREAMGRAAQPEPMPGDQISGFLGLIGWAELADDVVSVGWEGGRGVEGSRALLGGHVDCCCAYWVFLELTIDKLGLVLGVHGRWIFGRLKCCEVLQLYRATRDSRG